MPKRIRNFVSRLRSISPLPRKTMDEYEWDDCRKNARDEVDVILCKSIKEIARELMGEAVPSPKSVNKGLCSHLSDKVVYNTQVGSLSEKEDIEIKRLVTIVELEDGDVVNRHLKEFESGDLNIEHCWFEYNGRHFDAEVPSGVDDMNNLPIFKRLDVTIDENI